jgi:hypothetical protein
MAAVPQPLHTTAAAIYRAYEARERGEGRAHLGASLIGHACVRYLWLSFRWAAQEAFDGRMLRLFETGKLEEARLVADLRAIGCEVSEGPAPGEQWRVTAHGGHCGGSMDAAVQGLPEAPAAWHVAEFKTHSAKNFAGLAKGVQKAQPRHWAQMQLYMGLTGMKRAVYIAVNKDTDELHVERIEFAQAEFDKLMERARVAIFSPEPPAKISDDASWYVCKFCHFHELCHGTAAPAVSCRSCVHATPEPDGEARWSCARHSKDLELAEQRVACPEHRHFPILLGRFAELVAADADRNAVRYRNLLNGAEFGQPEYTSAEIHAVQDKRALGHPEIETWRSTFGARLIAPSECVRWVEYDGGRHLGLYDAQDRWVKWLPQTPENVERAKVVA